MGVRGERTSGGLKVGLSASHPSSRDVGGPRGPDSPSPICPDSPGEKTLRDIRQALHQTPGPWTVIQGKLIGKSG